MNKLDYSDKKAVELSYKMFDAVTIGNKDMEHLSEFFMTNVKEIYKETVKESSTIKKETILTESYIDNQNCFKTNNQTEKLYKNDNVSRWFEVGKWSESDNKNSEKLKTIIGKASALILVIIMIFLLFKILN